MTSLGEGSGLPETNIPPLNPDTALASALRNVYSIGFEPGFEQFAQNRGMSPDEISDPTPQYWSLIAEYAHTKHEDSTSTEDPRQERFNELFAITPDYVNRQLDFNDRTRTLNPNERQETRLRASYFMNMLGDIAYETPDLKPSQLANSLMNAVNVSIESPKRQAQAKQLIESSIIGTQHELAFGKLLQAGNFDFRRSDVEEDLHGADYVITTPAGNALAFDVKASLHNVGAGDNPTVPYAFFNNRSVKMYSMLTPDDFKDSFTISDAVVARKGPIVTKYIQDVITQTDIAN